ncbi:MAG TPA: TetR/AcrR family transcriptional regulator, partial [Pseudonocardiaceae bacterium]
MAKSRYHHGDLRNGLLEAAARLAEQGPEAVTVRACAKLVGVTPTAAYRHFAGHDELLLAVKDRAMEALGEAMSALVEKLRPQEDPLRAGLARLAALGRGYVDFAVAQPGLFRTAFACAGELPDAEWPDDPGGPCGMLAAAIDDLVTVGYIAPASRPMAEFAMWAAVHGLGTLFTEGPLAGLPAAQREPIVDRTLAAAGLGLGDGPRADEVRDAGLIGSSCLGRPEG